MKKQNGPLKSEFTVLAVLLGVALSLVMCAANTYLGLYAGMTVSASIPAAVISMGILRGVFRRGTILENNIVQTIASAGESLAAGIIFTVPALVISGVWADFNYWETTLIAATGGLLGVLFMIPLRRPLIIEEKGLTFPEGVACAQVLEAGDTGGAKVLYVFASLIAGAAFKFLVSGITLIKGTLEWAFRPGRAVFYAGSDISPALLGVGYIVGFNVAALVFIGGCIGWVAGIPLYSLYHAADVAPLDFAWETWSSQIRYMGVGAMIVGGAWSIINVAGGIVSGLRQTLNRTMKDAAAGDDPQQRDISPRIIGALLLLTVFAVFAVYRVAVGSMAVGAVATVMMTAAAFFFVAVSSYIVGLVGSSNNPVSGMTICTVLLTGLVLLLFGMSGKQGMLATLCVAGVVCCAACTAGDVSQDLKTGQLVGATPANQQWGQIIGVVASAFIIAPILVVLHHSYGIGTDAPGALKAPQATLFKGIVEALFGHKALPWTMIYWGMGVGVAIIVLDEILKRANAGFRTYVMPVAVGIYLPLSLSVPIFIGGLLAHLVRKSPNAEHGVLCASGLIAGEAITGILVGAVVYFNKDLLPVAATATTLFTLAASALVVFGLLAVSSKSRAQ